MNEKVDTAYLVYNEFKSVLQQRVVVERLLPIGRLVPNDTTTDPVAPMDHGLSLIHI